MADDLGKDPPIEDLIMLERDASQRANEITREIVARAIVLKAENERQALRLARLESKVEDLEEELADANSALADVYGPLHGLTERVRAETPVSDASHPSWDLLAKLDSLIQTLVEAGASDV